MKKKASGKEVPMLNSMDKFRLSPDQMKVFAERLGPHGAKHVEREFFNIGIANMQLYDIDLMIEKAEQEIKQSDASHRLKVLRAERAASVADQVNRKQKLHGILDCHFDGLGEDVPLFRKMLLLENPNKGEGGVS